MPHGRASTRSLAPDVIAALEPSMLTMLQLTELQSEEPDAKQAWVLMTWSSTLSSRVSVRLGMSPVSNALKTCLPHESLLLEIDGRPVESSAAARRMLYKALKEGKQVKQWEFF